MFVENSHAFQGLAELVGSLSSRLDRNAYRVRASESRVPLGKAEKVCCMLHLLASARGAARRDDGRTSSAFRFTGTAWRVCQPVLVGKQ